jgi:hypothetical protein
VQLVQTVAPMLLKRPAGQIADGGDDELDAVGHA